NREKDGILLQQDKLASIGQLAAGVAHEINNPMGFIMSNLRTLKNYTETEQQYLNALEEAVKNCCPEEQRRQLEELRQRLDLSFIQEDIPPLITESLEGAERVKQIVHDLKDFARSDENSLKETDLNQCVQSTANIVRNEIRYVADLDLNLGEIPLIVCNPQQINQVIANLLVNAAHAIDGHGRITVSTSSEWDQVLLTVADTGCGIPDEIRKRIFDPFFTTKEVGKGTGLGLSISYDIIKKHGGEITLESEPGLGTTFMIRLPISGPEEIKA
ncbi:MAG: histidine kinase, partial [Deltaproteobacteria bacterium]|nr:histidine kinase [Deltaproteobacteria bacterium]